MSGLRRYWPAFAGPLVGFGALGLALGLAAPAASVVEARALISGPAAETSEDADGPARRLQTELELFGAPLTFARAAAASGSSAETLRRRVWADVVAEADILRVRWTGADDEAGEKQLAALVDAYFGVRRDAFTGGERVAALRAAREERRRRLDLLNGEIADIDAGNRFGDLAAARADAARAMAAASETARAAQVDADAASARLEAITRLRDEAAALGGPRGASCARHGDDMDLRIACARLDEALARVAAKLITYRNDSEVVVAARDAARRRRSRYGALLTARLEGAAADAERAIAARTAAAARQDAAATRVRTLARQAAARPALAAERVAAAEAYRNTAARLDAYETRIEGEDYPLAALIAPPAVVSSSHRSLALKGLLAGALAGVFASIPLALLKARRLRRVARSSAAVRDRAASGR
ncbi:MAG: hypothetical protein ACFB00_07200 [Parvularculaceae bacterium]